uniref:Heat shock 70 kDa protein 12B-like isoform X2 n=1 Tax=Crassostrea virginica TaxID=6565 RepID=A0A8B8C5J8_CRAVI|nr:heat shock 70 kDa protein 12B-like isoform X2 [Crassostrea virginica]
MANDQDTLFSPRVCFRKISGISQENEFQESEYHTEILKAIACLDRKIRNVRQALLKVNECRKTYIGKSHQEMFEENEFQEKVLEAFACLDTEIGKLYKEVLEAFACLDTEIRKFRQGGRMDQSDRRFEKPFVTAIDFGSTYSGYAFCNLAEKPTSKIQSSIGSGKEQTLHEKTASSILFNPDKSFNSFGFTAEEQYSKMWQDYVNGEFKNEKFPDNKTPSDWFLFRHFKTNLYGKKDCHNDMTINDETGKKSLPLKTIIRESVRYLKEQALKCCSLTGNDVRWVLTVPTIFSDSQKEFMRSAAIEAGIPSESLMIAFESEAAALLTKEQELCRVEKNGNAELLPFTPKSILMIIDLGGGFVETTLLNAPNNQSLKTTGGFWGGNKVNVAFMQIWIDVLGDDFTRCMDSFPNEVLDLWQDFEVQKRSIGESFGKDYLCVLVPEFCREISHFKEKFENSAKYPGINVNRGKVEFPHRLIENLFMTTIQEIICHVGGLLKEISVDAIILVGGFSESKFVYQSMKDAFKNVLILKPHEGSLSVLKGALLYGSQC